jgi:hypothetical protein
MDVYVNHFNTRGAPTGFMEPAAGMPFPWYAHHMHKAMKVHFLAACHHLTGDRRAKEVMDEVIAGAKLAAQNDPHQKTPSGRGRARELYNMSVFWVNAWEETGDPALKAFAREWFDLSVTREFSEPLAEFRNPPIYLYNGLVLQQRLWNDPRATRVMLKNLAHYGYPALENGGVWDVERAIACGWACEQTKDERFIRVAWDVARALADLVPDHDWNSPDVAKWPYAGHQSYRHLLGPIVTGASLAAKHGLRMDEPFVRRDTFVSLAADARGRVAGEARLRPRADGDLPVRVWITTSEQRPAAPLKVTALDAGGRKLAETTLTMKPAEQTPERHFVHQWWFCEGRLAIAGAKRGATYTLRFEGAGNPVPLALVLADAQIVHRKTPGQLVDFYQEAGQYYAGARMFTRTTAETVKIENPNHVPFTLRDARTHALLFHSSTTDPQVTEHKLGKGRDIFLTQPGRRSPMKFEGLSSWLSATREGWFDPEAEHE